MHLELDAFLKRVRLLVASKSHVRVGEQLVSNRVSKRVVLLTNEDGGCILLSLVIDALD